MVPWMKNTLRGWTKKYNCRIVTQTIVNNKPVFTEGTLTEFVLNKQPLKKSIVDKKPEGERKWKWWNINVTSGPVLDSNDIIIIESIKYKIMSSRDWSESGFYKYEAIEDFQ